MPEHSQGCRQALAHRATTLVHKSLRVVPELARRDRYHGTNSLLARALRLVEILGFSPEPFASLRAGENLGQDLLNVGEGHRPWDLMPNSTMTNATVAQAVKGAAGNEITLKYKEGEKKIVVVPETVIVTYVPGDKSELKPGAKIFIGAANKKDDGTLEASAVSVGRDGLTPPM